MPPWLRQAPDGVFVEVVVQPRASRTRVSGEHGGRLKIQLAAPPVDGEANAALVAFVADALGVRKADVAIERGQAGRRKTLRVSGADPQRIMAWGARAGSGD
jgi:hypothetical protein